MNDEILEYASRTLGGQEQSSQAEVAVDTVDSDNVQQDHASAEVAGGEVNDQNSSTEETVVETPSADTTVETETPPVTDYWKEFEAKTGGLVKDEESLNVFLERAKSFETLQTEKSELEKNQWKPANEYVETLNKLISEGASAEQQKAFIKLNGVGDLSTLDPVEAKVAKMVLIDKYSEDIARKIVANDFPLDEFDEDSDEYLIAKEKLRVSSSNDLEALKEYKKELSVVDNPEKAQAEQNRLSQIAAKEAYTARLNQEVPKIVGNFPEKFTFNVKVSDEEVPFNLNIKSDFPKEEMIRNYFAETGAEINQESVKDAYSYVYAHYVSENLEGILQDQAKQLESKFEEVYANKYENRSGLPKPSGTVDKSSSTATEYDNFLKSMVG